MGLVVVVVRGRVFTSDGWVSCMLLKADGHPCSSSPSLTECDRLIRWITVGTVGRGWWLQHALTWWCGPPSLHAPFTAFLTPVHTWMPELCSRLGRSSCFSQCIYVQQVLFVLGSSPFLYTRLFCVHLSYIDVTITFLSAYLVPSALCLSSFAKLWG